MKSLDDLRDVYLAAIAARITADSAVQVLLTKGHMASTDAAEWAAALEADLEAEKRLPIAREAYQQALRK